MASSQRETRGEGLGEQFDEWGPKMFFFEYPQNPLVYQSIMDFSTLSFLVKFWCIPLFQGKKAGCSAGGFSADPATAVGLDEVSTSAPVTMVTGRYVDEELLFFRPAAAIGLFFFEFLWQLEIIDDIQPYIWGVSGKLL